MLFFKDKGKSSSYASTYINFLSQYMHQIIDEEDSFMACAIASVSTHEKQEWHEINGNYCLEENETVQGTNQVNFCHAWDCSGTVICKSYFREKWQN